MKEEIEYEKRNTKTYILFDLAVSVFLVIAFQLLDSSQAFSFFLFAGIPCLFLQYAEQIPYKVNFYRWYSGITVLVSYVIIFGLDKTLENKFTLPIFSFCILIAYLIFVVGRCSEKSTSVNASEDSATINEKDLFKKIVNHINENESIQFNSLVKLISIDYNELLSKHRLFIKQDPTTYKYLSLIHISEPTRPY